MGLNTLSTLSTPAEEGSTGERREEKGHNERRVQQPTSEVFQLSFYCFMVLMESVGDCSYHIKWDRGRDILLGL